MIRFARRNVLTLAAAATTAFALPRASRADAPWEVWWEDLIPDGVPYGEIIGEGDLDLENDTWAPIFDDNAFRLNDELDGAYIRMPGYIIPLETSAEGVTTFLLVPYVGACIHTPPPPPNQLVYVTSETPWPNDQLWDPVWVTGIMRTSLQSTELAETGYELRAEAMEVFEW